MVFSPVVIVLLVGCGLHATVADARGPYSSFEACQARLDEMVALTRKLPIETVVKSARCDRR